MPDAITLRFLEWRRYEIEFDAEVIMLQGITGKGTFTAQFEVKSAQDTRTKRAAFREYVEQQVSYGIEPHEVNLEEVHA